MSIPFKMPWIWIYLFLFVFSTDFFPQRKRADSKPKVQEQKLPGKKEHSSPPATPETTRVVTEK